MTDSLGRFRLADIPVGRYTIQVSAIGYGSHEVTGVAVTAGATDAARPHTDTLHRGRGRRPDRRRQAGGGRLAGDVADGSDVGAAANGPAVRRQTSRGEHRELRGYRGVTLPAGRHQPALDLLDRRRHRELRQRPALPHRRAAAAEGRGADRGAGQLLPLRRPAPRRATTRSRHASRSAAARGRRSTGWPGSGIKGRDDPHASSGRRATSSS